MSFFFFKQKTAYELRISDWSSDVCSSDLHHVVENTADMLVGRRIEDVAATPLGTYEARRAQQPQMMADQRGRGAHPPGAGADRHRLAEPGQHDAPPRRIAQKKDGLCELGGGGFFR